MCGVKCPRGKYLGGMSLLWLHVQWVHASEVGRCCPGNMEVT